MTACVSDMIDLMEQVAAPDLAEDWDNCGLQVGDRKWAVRRVGVALDASPAVVAAACEMKADLLITHHPLIFRPLRSIDCRTLVGSIVEQALVNRIAIYAAHTNYDKTDDGLNDILARRIGLSNCSALEISKAPDPASTLTAHQGIGRVGSLTKAATLNELAVNIKERLNLESIKIAGRPDLMISKAAVCTGSGSSLINAFLRSGAQVYISGDLRFHDAREIEAADLSLIDIGHFPSEYLMVEALVERLSQMVKQQRLEVNVQRCGVEVDPFVSI